MWQVSWCIAPCSVEDPSVVCAADVLHLFCCVPRVPFAGGHLGCPVFATEEVVLLSVLLRVSWCTGMPMPLGLLVLEQGVVGREADAWLSYWEVGCYYLWRVEPTIYRTLPNAPHPHPGSQSSLPKLPQRCFCPWLAARSLCGDLQVGALLSTILLMDPHSVQGRASMFCNFFSRTLITETHVLEFLTMMRDLSISVILLFF